MKKPLLIIDNVTVNAYDKVIYKVDNFKVNEGEIVFILGKNGSGKSSFFRRFFSSAPTGFEGIKLENHDNSVTVIKGDDGDFILGENYGLNDIKYHKKIIYSKQEEIFNRFDNILVSLTRKTNAVIEKIPNNKELKDKLRKFAVEEGRHILKYANSKLEINNLSDKEIIRQLKRHKSTSLSGGTKRLVTVLADIIFTKVIKPTVLVMDEPLNHLDFNNQIYIKNKINELFLEGTTILLISHYLYFPFFNHKRCKKYLIKNNKMSIYTGLDTIIDEQLLKTISKIEENNY